MSTTENNWVFRTWYGESAMHWFLLPLSWLYSGVISLRHLLYRIGLFRSHEVGVPVIVVGNISVGGTGKTPLTIWLARALLERGFSPFIVSRGYRGKVGATPLEATVDSDPAIVGDEAILLSGLSQCRVVVHPDRVAAAARAIELGADIIISDDGLQHYRLARDCEIAVIDGQRGFGNGYLLPAGPLREKKQRLELVDRVIVQGIADRAAALLSRDIGQDAVFFDLHPTKVRRLDDSKSVAIDHFAGQRVHAVAGIGNPERFFTMLETHGMDVVRHPLPDHASISLRDLTFTDELPVIMTAKDAVKCRFPQAEKCWCVDVDVIFEGKQEELLLTHLLGKVSASQLSE